MTHRYAKNKQTIHCLTLLFQLMRICVSRDHSCINLSVSDVHPQQSFTHFFLYSRSLLMFPIKTVMYVLCIKLWTWIFIAHSTVRCNLLWNYRISFFSMLWCQFIGPWISLSGYFLPAVLITYICHFHIVAGIPLQSTPHHGWHPSAVNTPSYHLVTHVLGVYTTLLPWEWNRFLSCLPNPCHTWR